MPELIAAACWRSSESDGADADIESCGAVELDGARAGSSSVSVVFDVITRPPRLDWLLWEMLRPSAGKDSPVVDGRWRPAM